ncbi:uncharacterized protein B4U80_12761 [Leptotrombidium deliense]|uniref:AAA+ ATPase domain-containing protein n=1 Tax=Leptotrombidium deliense TaxID=299467 RepID=A0A443SN42_9ACAR|nr:uncharacterized protein B4U80_12761 [Leptotrombidium deliense]
MNATKSVKLAPIFLKNYKPAKVVSQKNTTKKRGRPKKVSQEAISKTNDEVVDISVEDDSVTEFYFTAEEESNLRKKFKSFYSDEDTDVEECVFDTNSTNSDMWTSKYKDSAFRNRICCRESFGELSRWLQDWKHSNSQASQTDAYDSGTESRSCLLIYGPPGTGKTSLAYAVAQELEFKVFEVNCSSRRNGRSITERLKEATESLTINCNKCKIEDIKSISEVKIIEEKKPKSSLLSYFKKSENTTAEYKKLERMNSLDSNNSQNTHVSNISITNDCLLLFDDVDVLFEEDEGFWRAVNTIVESGKPVVLTASRSLEKIRTFVSEMKILKIKPPKNEDLVTLLREVALEEDLSLPDEDCHKFVFNFDGDIRRCLNELQFRGKPFVDTNLSNKCSCDNIYSKTSYEAGLILDLLSSNSNVVDVTQRRDMFMQGFPHEVPDRNWNLFNNIQSEISMLSSKLHPHSNCKSGRHVSQFTMDEDTQELLNIRTVIAFNPLTSDVVQDYLPYLFQICKAEEARRKQFIAESRRCRRFHHYLDSISFFISDKLKNVLINRFKVHE